MGPINWHRALCQSKKKMNSATESMGKLNSLNYSIWKPIIEDLIYCRDLYDPIEGALAKPRDKTYKEWEKLNRKNIGTIRQWVDI